MHLGLDCLFTGCHLFNPPGNQQMSSRKELLYLLEQFIPAGILFVHYMPPWLNRNRLQGWNSVYVALYLFIIIFCLFEYLVMPYSADSHIWHFTPLQHRSTHRNKEMCFYLTQVSQHSCLWMLMLITHTYTESALSPSSLCLLWISYTLWDGTLTLK